MDYVMSIGCKNVKKKIQLKNPLLGRSTTGSALDSDSSGWGFNSLRFRTRIGKPIGDGSTLEACRGVTALVGSTPTLSAKNWE